MSVKYGIQYDGDQWVLDPKTDKPRQFPTEKAAQAFINRAAKLCPSHMKTHKPIEIESK